jgi:hypothetical protein
VTNLVSKGAWTVVILFAALRWLTWHQDFPPISGSLGEYADMGYNFANLHAFWTTGHWDLDRVPLLFLCPIYYGLVFLSIGIFGNTLFACRAISLLAGTAAIGMAGFAGRKQAAAVAGGAALLLATDALWFAYSRCEKQEVTGATLLCVAAVVLGGEARRRFAGAGVLVGLALLVKANLLMPAGGLALAVLARDPSSRNMKAAGCFVAGIAVACVPAALFLAHPLITEFETDQFKRMIDFYKLGIGAPTSFASSIFSIVRTNLYVRSPLSLVGLLLALAALVKPNRASRLEIALAGIIVASALAPAMNSYFPLRYRIVAIPACAILVPLAAARWTESRGGLARSALVASGIAIALVGVLQIANWTKHTPSEIVEIGEELRRQLKPGTRVATNGWWGELVLLHTDCPEAAIEDGTADAWLYTNDPGGSWARGTAPPSDIAASDPVLDRKAWFGARYRLWVNRNGASAAKWRRERESE